MGGGYYKLLYYVNYWKYRRLGFRLGFSIGFDTLGYGVYIPHYGTIVIGNSNRIGNYAVIHTCTCVTDNEKQIGDGFYLSVGAIVTSKTTIGDNVTIGANSLVNKAIAGDNILIGGSPAKVIKDSEAWFIRDGFKKRIDEIERLKEVVL